MRRISSESASPAECPDRTHGVAAPGTAVASSRRRWTRRFGPDDMAYLDAAHDDGVFAVPAAREDEPSPRAAGLPGSSGADAAHDIRATPGPPARRSHSLPPFGGRALPSSRFAPAATVPAPARWRFPETDPGAAAFNRFGSRLPQTAGHRDAGRRAALEQRVDALAGAMRAAPALRAVCFQIADDAVGSCGDRIALGLHHMELARIDHEAAEGRLAAHDLLAMGEGLFKAHLLQQIAGRKIAALARAGLPVDDTEVHLAYQVELADRLALPRPAGAMLYRRLADVSGADLAAAEQEVGQALARSASVDYLAQWPPWRRAMERAWPEAYDAVRAFNQAPRDALAMPPRRMSEQEWRDAFAAQAADEHGQMSRLTARLTRRFLEENGID